MKLGRALFARLGLFSRTVSGPDAFELRLQRIGLRERRCQARAGQAQAEPAQAGHVRGGVFKIPSSRPAA